MFVYEGVANQERGKYAGYLVSGETLSSIIKECRHIHSNHCPFSLSSGANAGTSLGIIIATSIRSGTNDQALESWGWRVPFLLTPVVGGMALYFLHQLEHVDDDEFKEAKTKSKQQGNSSSENDKVMDGMVKDNKMWNVLIKYRWEIMLLMFSLGQWSPMVRT